ncbi:MAG: DegV family EDD domain-containing protein [Lachnospiraceae bacterium]|nr:DegV family EDD domain-containing protein [Lachnospiraceae bacterium]
MRRFLKYINNREESMEDRRFAILTMSAIAALFMVFLVDLFIRESMVECIALGLTVISVPVITFTCIKKKKLKIAVWAVVLGIVFVMLPTCFYFGGGFFGGAILWIPFAYFYIGMVLSGVFRYVMLTVLTVCVSTLYYVDCTGMVTILHHSVRDAYIDSFASAFVVGMVIFVMEMFQKNVYEQENERVVKQAKEIEELNKAQNRFFSNMSHEIRTPINTIIGLNEMILREDDISDEVVEDAMNIKSASQMLLHLINDILDMSKIESGKMEINTGVYNVGEMLSDIVGIMWIRAKEKGLAFHVYVDPLLPAELYGDEVRIKQILINILTNGIKYTKEGSVTLSISYEKMENDQAKVVYSVTDTGIGIKKESIPYLFSAFQRIEENENRHIEGTGLGLSIVKQFVDMMGGEIRVNSIYTQGSTFIVDIPQKVASRRQVGQLNLENHNNTENRARYKKLFEAPEARLLVVDDNAANLLVVTKFLRDTKIKIETAMNGRDALKKTLETRYHIILMDHLMPEMDGIECLHEIRRQEGGLNKDTRVVVLTANAGSDSKELYSKEGFDGYLVKPIGGEELEYEVLSMLPKDMVLENTRETDRDDRTVDLVKTGKKYPLIITTDSVSDLKIQEIRARDIPVLPYYIKTEGGIFLDGVETETRDVISCLSDGAKNISSYPPSVKEYEQFFAKQLTKANAIIHITLSGKVSSGYRIASEAAQTFGNVTVYDSEQVSGGVAMMVLTAEQMSKNGLSADRIIEELNEMKGRLQSSFVIENTDYLTEARLIKREVNVFANAFLWKLAIKVKKGSLKTKGLVFGSGRALWKRYINRVIESTPRINKKWIYVGHTGLNRADQDYIRNIILKKVDFHSVIFIETSPSIAVNIGPGALGLFYETL